MAANPEIILHPTSWQEHFLQILNTEPGEKILWIYDEVGASGKTTFVNNVIAVNPDNAIQFQGTKNIRTMADMYNRQQIVLFDIPVMEGSTVKDCAEFAQNLKDGRVFKLNYHSRVIHVNPPHVIFLANFRPNNTWWSQWKLQIYVIRN